MRQVSPGSSTAWSPRARRSCSRDPLSEDDERTFLAALAPRGGFHVAETRGETGSIVAAQVFAPYAAGMPAHDHVAVMGTWVAAPWRRGGLGRSLWERTEALARSRGFTRVFTDLRADNLDSLAYHLALGFSVAGVARALAVVDGRAYDVVFIERGL